MTDLKTHLESLRLDRGAVRAGSRRGLWIGLAAVLLAVLAGGWWWASRTQAATVRTAAVTARGATGGGPGTVLNASGYVTARRRATVSSKVTGKVAEVLVEEGMRVKRGQVLARLDDSIARASLSLTEAQLASAQKRVAEDRVRLREAELQLGRQERLAAEGVVPQADLDTARAQADAIRARIAAGEQEVAVAEREVALRRTELNDLVIRAPFDGVAVSKDAQPGEMISPVSAGGGFTRTGICTLVDMSSLEIEVDVNEAYINRVQPEQTVTAVLDAYPDWEIPARVITMVPTADRQKATVLVRIDFEKLDPRILPDMGVKVSFLQSEAASNRPAGEAPRQRLYVPRRAVRSEAGRDVVLVVRDGLTERRAVRLGRPDGEEVEVLSGVNAGERVVIDGPADLGDGAKVEETRP
jgi:HlyD family secretion protein